MLTLLSHFSSVPTRSDVRWLTLKANRELSHLSLSKLFLIKQKVLQLLCCHWQPSSYCSGWWHESPSIWVKGHSLSSCETEEIAANVTVNPETRRLESSLVSLRRVALQCKQWTMQPKYCSFATVLVDISSEFHICVIRYAPSNLDSL